MNSSRYSSRVARRWARPSARWHVVTRCPVRHRRRTTIHRFQIGHQIRTLRQRNNCGQVVAQCHRARRPSPRQGHLPSWRLCLVGTRSTSARMATSRRSWVTVCLTGYFRPVSRRWSTTVTRPACIKWERSWRVSRARHGYLIHRHKIRVTWRVPFQPQKAKTKRPKADTSRDIRGRNGDCQQHDCDGRGMQA